MRKFFLVIFFCSIGLLVNLYAQESSQVRIAVNRDFSSVQLKIRGLYEIEDTQAERILLRGKDLNSAVAIGEGGIFVGGKFFPIKRLRIRTDANLSSLALDNRYFRGDIEFILQTSGKLLAVNHLGLEDYIKGIFYLYDDIRMRRYL